MKDQYFGDVNDYVKYGLLRAFTSDSGMRIGVAWMRTPDDDRPDGALVAYRSDASWREHDPELFDRLARLASRPAARGVELFRRWALVPGALDVDAMLPEESDARAAWMLAAREALRECTLVFFDPDNGFEVESVPIGRRGSNRYLYWHEARAAWDAGHSLLVHLHVPREGRGAFASRLRAEAARHLPGARVTTLHTPHALFLLAAQPGHAAALARGMQAAVERWRGRLTVDAPGEPDDRARAIADVCEALVAGGADAATEALARRYPRGPAPAAPRRATRLQQLSVWLDDGFIDRYDGGRLVFPGVLRLLSAELPGAFPYHRNWRSDATHPAYWELLPTLDHVQPLARGGADERSNWVSTSQLHNSARGQWTLEELGWSLRPAGRLSEWDGLTGWYRSTLEARPELRRHAVLRAWAGLLERALAERASGDGGAAGQEGC